MTVRCNQRVRSAEMTGAAETAAHAGAPAPPVERPLVKWWSVEIQVSGELQIVCSYGLTESVRARLDVTTAGSRGLQGPVRKAELWRAESGAVAGV